MPLAVQFKRPWSYNSSKVAFTSSLFFVPSEYILAFPNIRDSQSKRRNIRIYSFYKRFTILPWSVYMNKNSSTVHYNYFIILVLPWIVMPFKNIILYVCFASWHSIISIKYIIILLYVAKLVTVIIIITIINARRI